MASDTCVERGAIRLTIIEHTATYLAIYGSRFNNPTHVTLPQSSKASCLGIVSLEAPSQVAAAA
jgi:hypothetical protein